MAVLYAAKLLLNLPHPWPDCLSEAEAPKKETEQSQNGEIAPGVRLLSCFLSLHQKILRWTPTDGWISAAQSWPLSLGCAAKYPRKRSRYEKGCVTQVQHGRLPAASGRRRRRKAFHEEAELNQTLWERAMENSSLQRSGKALNMETVMARQVCARAPWEMKSFFFFFLLLRLPLSPAPPSSAPREDGGRWTRKGRVRESGRREAWGRSLSV